MKTFDINKIEKGFEWLQREFEDIEIIQSIDVLIQKISALSATLSWSNEMMAIAKFNYNEAKLKAYLSLMASEIAQDKKPFSPMLAKDYIASKCSQAAYEYDLIERFSRTCVHISDNLRTCISALKETQKLELQSERIPNY